MSTEVDAAEVVFDPYDPGLHDDPYPTYRKLRDLVPVYHNEQRGFWALSRYADVHAAARDWQTFSSLDSIDLDETPTTLGLNSFIDLDPPRHDVLRNVIRQHFSPPRVKSLEAQIRVTIDELLDALPLASTVDFAEFAWRLPFAMVRKLMGFPDSDADMLNEWFRTLLYRDLRPDIPDTARVAAAAMREYFEQRAAAERSDGSTVMSTIAAAEAAGVITRRELGDMCFLLFIAGYETTMSAITNSILALAEHPDRRALLIREPARIPSAVEELLRYQSPVQFLGRTTVRAVEIQDHVIPEGARVLLLFGSANRDERKFPDPDTLDFTRGTSRHVAFGFGLHFCLGAPLARLELALVLETVVRRYPDYSLAGTPRRFRRLTMYGLESLPVNL